MWNETWADKCRRHFGKHQCNFHQIMQYLEKGGMLANPQGFGLFFCKIGFFFLFNHAPPPPKKKNLQAPPAKRNQQTTTL